MGANSQIILPLLLLSLLASSLFTTALSHGPLKKGISQEQAVNRRDALVGAASSASSAAAGLLLSSFPTDAIAATSDAESVDLAAFNAARTKGSGGSTAILTQPGASPPSIGTKTKIRHTIQPTFDPKPLLPIKGGRSGKSFVQIPRVGYSLYKTPPELTERCVALALRSGVRHFDVATLYGTNLETCKPLKQYLDGGFSTLSKRGYYKEEKPELLELLDATSNAAEKHAVQTLGLGSKSVAPPIDGSAGRRARRDQLFISHKLSNEEQSTNILEVKRTVKNTIAELGIGYLDMVSIHSPLTDRDRRLNTFQALLELRDAGFVRSVGVCNYGLGALKEIQEYVREDDFMGSGGSNEHLENLPAVNQLELSPFNLHADVVQYCDAYGIAVGCSAWSKLSGVDGPAEGWAVLADLAKVKGVTKAQLLVRWSLQKGYICVPRSGSKSKVERMAIAENSYGGVNPPMGSDAAPFVLTEEEMKILDGLDLGYKAGKLGRRDGWGDEDVTGPEWDPTEFV